MSNDPSFDLDEEAIACADLSEADQIARLAETDKNPLTDDDTVLEQPEQTTTVESA